MSDSLVQAIERAILPVLARDGYELVLTEYSSKAKVLRLYIDKEAGAEVNADAPSGISLEDCQRVSRLVSDVMDAEGISDGIDGRFTLEVSSPGLDRPLVKPKDFQRFVGRQVQLSTREMLEGRRKFSGALTAADEGAIKLDVDGKPWTIAYDVIERARLVPEF
ncbi:MAG: ribosome maturation factor RimP [Myxococcota bacterium]